MRASLVALGTAGCFLISADVTKLSFDLPTKTYSFDTQSWNVPAGGVPAVACTVTADCCVAPVDCNATPLVCDGGTCAFQKVVVVTQRMDLGTEVPQLRSAPGQSLADVFVSRISYKVASTLNVDLPEVSLYLAPDGTTNPDDGQKFGTVPIVHAGESRAGDVNLADGAQQTFAMYSHDPAKAFMFLARTTVVVRSGAPIPNGKVDIEVTGQISAQLNL